MKGWIRTGRRHWEQYVGRRVVLIGNVYFAYAGQTFCGKWTTLEGAQMSAASKW